MHRDQTSIIKKPLPQSPSFVIVTQGGSMRPLIKSGEPVRIIPTCVVHIGDCICYQIQEACFIHRVIWKKHGAYCIGSDSASMRNHWIDARAVRGKIDSQYILYHGISGWLYYWIIRGIFICSRYIRSIFCACFMRSFPKI